MKYPIEVESLESMHDAPWVVLDWGVVRGRGRKMSPPNNLVTVLTDVFAREAITASGNVDGIRVANTALSYFKRPHPVVIAQEWHSFDVDDSAPPLPLRAHQVVDEDCTRAVRSNLLAGALAFSEETGEKPTRTAKVNWQSFIDEMRPVLVKDDNIESVRSLTHNILEEPRKLLWLYKKSLPVQTNEEWTEAIASAPNGYPQFLFYAAILFYVSEFISKGRTNQEKLENDFDDIHYLVLAGVTGHLCTAEKSAGLGVAHLPDAAKHLFGDRVRIWCPGEWEKGAL